MLSIEKPKKQMFLRLGCMYYSVISLKSEGFKINVSLIKIVLSVIITLKKNKKSQLK